MTPQFPRVRRTNREVKDDAIIKEHLTKMPFGFIASCSNGQPFLNSNLFYYSEDDDTIYFHTIRNSNTENIFRVNNRACFSVASMGRLLPANEAVNFSTEYLSIVVYGETEIVTADDKIMSVFGEYFKKYFPGVPMSSIDGFTIADARKAVMFAIRILDWTCKMNAKEGVAPGAFFYKDNLDDAYVNQFRNFLG